MLSNDSIDIDIILSELNLCAHNPDFDLSIFFAAYSVDSEDVLSTHEDIMSFPEW